MSGELPSQVIAAAPRRINSNQTWRKAFNLKEEQSMR
jgi:hypothetical protein